MKAHQKNWHRDIYKKKVMGKLCYSDQKAIEVKIQGQDKILQIHFRFY